MDTALLRRSLSNLLTNAPRFASMGSTVDEDIAMSAPDVLQLSVSNTGPQIACEHLPRLFDRFYRVQASREHSDMHGLGLAIVAAIARMHGGETFVHSHSAHTTKGLRLPAVTPGAACAQQH